jgi:hypothetical protein
MYGNNVEGLNGSSMGPKPPEKIKEDIVGIKTIIESLAEEVAKLEIKKKQYVNDIKNNENLLNNILEDLNKDNKNFLAKLQTVADKKTTLTLSANEPFVKRNFTRIKEMLEEKSINLEGDTKRNSTKKSRQNSHSSFDDRGEHADRTKELEAENQFIFQKIAKDESRHVPAFLRNLALSQK